ncbi:MAG: hypothetical protein AAB900_01420, partial [Patescibacteria group bacterium]
MDKKIIIVLVIVVLLIASLALFKSLQSPATSDNLNEPLLPIPDQVATTSIESKTLKETGEEKDFTIFGTSFAFEPNKIEVSQGDRVKITFKDSDGLHDLKIEG